MSWLEMCRNCCHLSGIVQTGFNQVLVTMFLDLNGRSTWLYVPHELQFSGYQMYFRKIHSPSVRPPMLLPSCWMDLDSRLQHANFHPDHFSAGSLSNVILDHRNVFQSCNICLLYASLRSISVFIYRPWEAAIHCHPFEVFVILCKQR